MSWPTQSTFCAFYIVIKFNWIWVTLDSYNTWPIYELFQHLCLLTDALSGACAGSLLEKIPYAEEKKNQVCGIRSLNPFLVKLKRYHLRYLGRYYHTFTSKSKNIEKIIKIEITNNSNIWKAPLVADLFLFCYERDFMMSLSDDKQADVIDAFNTTSRYLDDILNINNVYFDNMVSQIYPSELQLNKANASDTEAAFLDLHLSISNDIVSTKIYDKRDDFDFEIVNFPFLDGDVPRSTSYGVYISQLIRFARASSYVVDFNTRNKLLTQKLLKQGYRYHKLRKTFSKFYRRYYDLISKFQVGLKSLLRQGLWEPDFYGDLVYKLKKIVGSNNFSAQFIKIISHYKKIGYNINVLQQTACLVVNPITVGNFAFLFNCTPVDRTSDSMMVPT